MSLWWWLLPIGVIVAGYVATVVIQAYLEVKDAPRTEMFICPAHGAVPMKYTLKLNIGTEKPIETCPMCFEDKMKAAKAGK